MDTKEYKLVLRFEDKRAFETVERKFQPSQYAAYSMTPGKVFDSPRTVMAITRLYQVPDLRMTITTHEVADSWDTDEFSHLAWELAEVGPYTDLALCDKFVASANTFAETVHEEVPEPDDRTDEQVQADYMECQNTPA